MAMRSEKQKNEFDSSSIENSNENGFSKKAGEKFGVCVYGFVGSFDDAIKPLLLLYMISSVIGTGMFAVFCKDGTRPFLLSTTMHLLPEILVWTHIIFPPAVHDRTQAKIHFQYRWGTRLASLVGFSILCLGPVNPITKQVGPVVLATYILMANISDGLALWLGMLMMARRTQRAARKIGIVFFVHGFMFHLAVYEYIANGNLLSMPELDGAGWILFLLATLFSFFFGLVPMLREPIDLRLEAPTPREFRFLAAGLFFTNFVMPLIGSGWKQPDIDDILSNPQFLPRHPIVLIAYKILVPILGLLFIVHALNVYVDERLPMLPIVAPNRVHKNVQS